MPTGFPPFLFQPFSTDARAVTGWHQVILSTIVGVTRLLLAGYTNDNDCMYINGTGQDVYDFYIQVSKNMAQRNLLEIRKSSC